VSRVALCPRCSAVLVMTFAFRKKEFYCLDCGGRWEFLAPLAADETPELDAKVEATMAEFKALAAGLIGDGVQLRTCPACKGTEPHAWHATPAEREADEQARVRLRERVTVPA
jgi:hypothetical protein